METSKEELQSLNEESATVNAELQARVDELFKTNDDIKNLLDSTEIATIFLDNDLGVRRFTPKATEIIPLAATDCGRPIKHLAPALIDTDLAEYGQQVLGDLAVRETEVESKDGRSYVMRVRPCRTVANVIDGVVITFEDITRRKQAEQLIQEAREYAENIVATVREPLIVLDAHLQVVTANRSFYETFKAVKEETEGRFVCDLGNRQWDIPKLRQLPGGTSTR